MARKGKMGDNVSVALGLAIPDGPCMHTGLRSTCPMSNDEDPVQETLASTASLDLATRCLNPFPARHVAGRKNPQSISRKCAAWLVATNLPLIDSMKPRGSFGHGDMSVQRKRGTAGQST